MIGFEDTEINCAGHQAPSHASCGGLEGKCSCWPNNWVLMMIPRCCITATRRDARTWWLREDGMVACVKGEIFLYKLGNIFWLWFLTCAGGGDGGGDGEGQQQAAAGPGPECRHVAAKLLHNITCSLRRLGDCLGDILRSLGVSLGCLHSVTPVFR